MSQKQNKRTNVIFMQGLKLLEFFEIFFFQQFFFTGQNLFTVTILRQKHNQLTMQVYLFIAKFLENKFR